MKVAYIDIHSHSLRSDIISLYSCRMGTTEIPHTTPHSIGIHPWNINAKSSLSTINKQINDFQALINPSTIAIGEIGLDFVSATTPETRRLQIELLERSLEIAQRLELPVIIHCVKAYNDLIKTLNYYTLRGVIIHGFIGSTELAQELLSHNYYISVGEKLLHSPKTQKALLVIPKNKLFIETDTSQLTVEQLYKYVAELRGVTLTELQNSIFSNYQKLFTK